MKIMHAVSYQDMSRKAANVISAQVILKPDCVLGLATGSSPVGTYQQLIDWYHKGDVDFSQVTSVNLDEYCGLGPEHPQSYRHFMNTNLFSKVNIELSRTHVPNGLAQNVQAECAAYDALIQSLGGIDLQLLGLGLDGHIGFNEPCDHFSKNTHCIALEESTRIANSRFFESLDQVPTHALTMGMQAIMQAKKVLLIVSGKEKTDILHRALLGDITPMVPASILQLHPDLTVVEFDAM